MYECHILNICGANFRPSAFIKQSREREWQSWELSCLYNGVYQLPGLFTPYNIRYKTIRNTQHLFFTVGWTYWNWLLLYKREDRVHHNRLTLHWTKRWTVASIPIPNGIFKEPHTRNGRTKRNANQGIINVRYFWIHRLHVFFFFVIRAF